MISTLTCYKHLLSLIRLKWSYFYPWAHDMIKLSRLADYAVVIMGQIAKMPTISHNAQTLAQLTNLPEPTVAKILTRLRRKNILQSQRGMHGGYGLGKKLDQISLADIITAIDGPINLTLCTSSGSERCSIENLCQSRTSWHKVNQSVRNILSSFALTDFIDTPPLLWSEQQGNASHGVQP